MAAYLVKTYNADPTKVYATVSSSGCMMTNVLLEVYPDVFAAGSCYSGVTAGCFAGSLVPSGQLESTPLYLSYNGTYPHMQTFHGMADNLVFYANLVEQLKEWSALLNVSFTSNVTNTPQSGYTKTVYGDGTKLVGFSAQGVGQTVPVHPQLDVEWFSPF
ncbi:putative PHB depolymerase family esterase [Seiridium cardinale]